jgi:cell division septation protein DedD
MKHEEKLNPKSLRTAVTEKRVSPDGGEQSASPAGASNPDRGTKNTSDLPGTVKGTSAPSADPSHGKSVYTVQAAAFKLQKDADALKQSLENKGYKVFIKKEPNPKGVVLYKVRVGEFGQKKDASVFALKLKKTDGLNAFAVIKN